MKNIKCFKMLSALNIFVLSILHTNTQQAFIDVEKGYFEDMDTTLAKRSQYQDQLPEVSPWNCSAQNIIMVYSSFQVFYLPFFTQLGNCDMMYTSDLSSQIY